MSTNNTKAQLAVAAVVAQGGSLASHAARDGWAAD
jgi:hypothetical protein